MALREMGIRAWHADDYSVFAKRIMYGKFSTRKWIETATKCRIEAISLEPIMDLFPFVLEHSPGAKVVLTWRTFKSWKKSSRDNAQKEMAYTNVSTHFHRVLTWGIPWFPLYDILTGNLRRARMRAHPFYGPEGTSLHNLLTRATCNTYFVKANDIYDRGMRKMHGAEESYLGLQDEVRRLTPKGDLLEFDPKTMGFKELADFLGVPAPNKSFPHPRSKDNRSNEQVFENNWWWNGFLTYLLLCVAHAANYFCLARCVESLRALATSPLRLRRRPTSKAGLNRLRVALERCPVVATVGAMEPAEMLLVAKTLADGGVRVIEVPTHSAGSADSVSWLKRHLAADVVVVAGSAMSSQDVDAAADAGAKFISSRHAEPWLLRRAQRFGLFPLASALTPNEAVAALHHGAGALVLQPAEQTQPAALAHLRRLVPQGVLILTAWADAPKQVAAYRAAGASGIVVAAVQLGPEGGAATVKKRLAKLLGET